MELFEEDRWGLVETEGMETQILIEKVEDGG